MDETSMVNCDIIKSKMMLTLSEHIFNFTLRPTFWLSVIPALLNIGFLFYTLKRFPKDKLVTLFVLFLVSIIGWQLSDSFQRISTTAEGASFWTMLLLTSPYVTLFGLHFILIYTRSKKLMTPTMIGVMYGVTFFVHAMFTTGPFRITPDRISLTKWGWIPPESYPLFFLFWISFLGILMVVVLVHYLFQDVQEVKRYEAARYLLIGISIPLIQGIITQVLFPLLGYEQWPITSTMLSFFSIAAILALKKYDFLLGDEGRILSHLEDPIITLNHEAVIVNMNKATTQMLGIDEEELVNQEFDAVFNFFDKQGERISFDDTAVWEALVYGKTSSNSLESCVYMQTADNLSLALIITANPVKKNEEIEGVIVTFRDVSREKELDDAKTEFISLASHELKSPAFVINWYIEKLLSGTLSTKEKEYVQKITEANKNSLKLLDKMLITAQLELGELEGHFKEFDVIELVQSCLTKFDSICSEKQLVITEHIKDSNILVQSDKYFLKLIIEELIENACYYANPKTRITMSIVNRSRSVSLSVTNIGLPILDRERENIFTKFYRGSNAGAKKAGKAGLGLYLIQKLILLLGGTIIFTSFEDDGTEFVVTIPKHP